MLDPVLTRATVSDVRDYLRIEKSVASPLTLTTTSVKDAKDEIRRKTVYMIRVEGEIAGLISYDRENKTTANICEVAIHPSFQRRGIGGKALAMILDEIRENGYAFVTLETHPENEARKLYERQGFTVTGYIKNYLRSGTPRLLLTLEFKNRRNP